jgi:hypothetical protein
MKRDWIPSCFLMLVLLLPVKDVGASEKKPWIYTVYLDLGYGYSFNKPENDRWRSKSTAYIFNTPRINIAFGYLGKEALMSHPGEWNLVFRREWMLTV